MATTIDLTTPTTDADFYTFAEDGTLRPLTAEENAALAAAFTPEPEPPAPATQAITRESLLEMFQPLPTPCTKKIHRLENLIDDVILASRHDLLTKTAAWNLRKVVHTLVSKRRQNEADLHEYVADHVLMAREKLVLAEGGHMCERCHDQPATRLNGLVCSNWLDASMCEACYEADRQFVEQEVARELAERAAGAVVLSAGEQMLSAAFDCLGIAGLLEREPETAEEWAASLDPVGLPACFDAPAETHEPLVLYDAADWLRDGTLRLLSQAELAQIQLALFGPEEPEPPEPSSPAAAPRPQQYGTEDDLEAFELASVVMRQYHQALPHILNHWDALCANWAAEAEGVSEAMVGWLEEEAAEWEGAFAA